MPNPSGRVKNSLYFMLTKKEEKINEAKRISGFNEYSRKYDASPFFPFNNSAILTTAEELFDIHRKTPATEKYGTFTDLSISNNSSYGIWLYPAQNRDRGIFIPSGVTQNFDRSSLGGGYTSFIIANAGAGTIAANEIRITCFKTGVDTNSIIKTATKLFVRALGMGMNKTVR